MHTLQMRIRIVDLPCPGAGARTRTRVDRSGGADFCRERPVEIKESDGFTQCEDHERWGISCSIDAARGLKNLGCAGVNIGRAVKDSTVLRDRFAGLSG